MTGGRATGSLAEPLIVGAAGLGGLLLVNPAEGGASWCPSALILGVACPLCGMTRGIARLVRGDVAASLDLHPLAGVVLLVAVAAWVSWLGRRAGWWTQPGSAELRPLVGLVAVALLVAWGWRAATGTLPPI